MAYPPAFGNKSCFNLQFGFSFLYFTVSLFKYMRSISRFAYAGISSKGFLTILTLINSETSLYLSKLITRFNLSNTETGTTSSSRPAVPLRICLSLRIFLISLSFLMERKLARDSGSFQCLSRQKSRVPDQEAIRSIPLHGSRQNNNVHILYDQCEINTGTRHEPSKTPQSS